MWRYFPCSIKECLRSKCSPKIHQRQSINHNCCFTKKLFFKCETKSQFNEEKGSSNDHKGKTWEANTHIQQRSWIGTLGWSGIIVLGWYLSQPSRFRALISNKINHDELKYASPAQILLKSVLAQPLNRILPKAITSGEQTSENGSNFLNDALEQAAENFAQAHGSIENRLGVELARRKRHEDAASLFQRAADRGHATAAFNLGLCYEMGLGTLQDFKKAAECYELASVGGHATATYNLGVFYVHGWGGKQANCVRARELFVTAAHLGQIDAKKALGITETKVQHNVESPQSLYKSNSKSMSHLVKDTVQKYTSLFEA